MHKTTLSLSACAAAAALALTGCTGASPYPTGEITELAEKDAWIEYDCTIDGLGEIQPETCEAEYVEDCYMVRFETSDGIEFADCTDRAAWRRLKVGETYTDD